MRIFILQLIHLVNRYSNSYHIDLASILIITVLFVLHWSCVLDFYPCLPVVKGGMLCSCLKKLDGSTLDFTFTNLLKLPLKYL